MKVVDVGSGLPVIVIPGVQGRWEWMKPSVNALALRCRVVTFSLDSERTSDIVLDETSGFWRYVELVRAAMDQAGLVQAVICGVSWGGLVAAAFAARFPERASALVLVSAIPPSWRPNRRASFYLRAPRALFPLFCLASVRMYREIAAVHDSLPRGLSAAVGVAWRALTHLASPTQMAARIHALESVNLRAEIQRVNVPTLVVTGEPHLDRVVPVGLTLEYLTLWPHARAITIARTGHLGMITRPERFASDVATFVTTVESSDAGRRVG